MRNCNLTKLGLLLAISLFSAKGYSQTIHRYVLEVETTRPVTTEVKGDIHGTYTINIEEPRKTIEYYEVLSNLSFASDFSLSGSNRELVKGQFHCSDLFVV